jgi:hypothetical protein
MDAGASKFTEVLSISAVLASTIGIFITHALARSRDQEKQHADNVKQEARELLTALYTLFAAYTPYATVHWKFYGPHKDEARMKEIDAKYFAATVEFYRILDDRLYIVEGIKHIQIKKRWDAASNVFWHNIAEEGKFKAEVDAIRDEIVAMALKSERSFLDWYQNFVEESDRV